MFARFALHLLTRSTTATLAVVGAAVGLLSPSASAQTTDIYGQGASFPAGVYRQYFNQYGTPIDLTQYPLFPRPLFGTFGAALQPVPQDLTARFFYASTGSGGGITAFTTGNPSGTAASNPCPVATVPCPTPTGFPSVYPRVDFGATDAVLTQAQYTTYQNTQAPTRGPLNIVPYSAGPVAFAFNATSLNLPDVANPNFTENPALGAGPSIKRLNLSRQAYCGIATGAITNWGDPLITVDNPTLAGTNLALQFVRRSDGSGTTAIFANHLNTVCQGLPAGFNWIGGTGTTVNWTPSFLSASGNAGITTAIQAAAGRIGYLSGDYTAIAPQPVPSSTGNPQVAWLQNQANITSGGAKVFIAPSGNNTTTGIPTTPIPGDGSGGGLTYTSPPCTTCFTQNILNPLQATAYPILGYSYLLVYSRYPSLDTIRNVTIPSDVANKIKQLTNRYVLRNANFTGQSTDADNIAITDGFTPFPNAVKQLVREVLSQITGNGGPLGLGFASWTPDPFFGNVGTFFTDVTGDGKADVIAVNTGGTTIRRSTGVNFGGNEFFGQPFYNTSAGVGRGTFLVDVTGDQRADVVVVNNSGIFVQRSNGSAFGPTENWGSAFYGDVGTYLADLDADGRADIIAVNASGTTIRRSTGSVFGPNEFWAFPFYNTDTGAGRDTFFVDVTGDNQADAVIVNNSGIFVQRSTGVNFGNTEVWSAPFFGDRATFVTDVDGDSKADFVALSNGGITLRRSTGVNLSPNFEGLSSAFFGSEGTFFADVTGNGLSAPIAVNSNNIVVRPVSLP